MKKYNIFVFLFCVTLSNLQAQESCDEAIEKVKHFLSNKSPFSNQSEILAWIEPCALMGNAEAENYLGMLYLEGIGVEINTEKAFLYISNAAIKDYANAQYNLGRLYKYGIGCNIDFIKAIDWFKKATVNGNQRAAYTLGYMYYKGFGVVQDYKQAVYWFERSDDLMAKHFLGLCYYLGYGVAANEDKALEILLSNPILNSKTLVDYIKQEQKEKVTAKVLQTLEDTNSESNPINPNVVTEVKNELEYFPNESLELVELKGVWAGKLLQYDWSGKHIQRILPIKIEIRVNENEDAKVEVTGVIDGKELSTKSVWQDETLYFEDLTITLNKLYSDHPRELTLDYTLLSTSLQKYNNGNTTYLIGNLDSYIPLWTEYGQPMSLVLKPDGAEGSLDEEALLALANQEDQFIKLYPVPFKDQLTIQYQLEATSNVYVELISLNGTNKVVILPSILQNAGEYTYTIPINSSLPEGLYVVRLMAGNQLFTRMIIKDI